MRSTPLRYLTVPFALFALVLLACSGTISTSPYDSVEKKDKAVAKEALPGKDFNKFFPKDQAKGEWDFVFGADKQGYAEGKLKKNGKDVAQLSITDTVSLPETRDKYKTSTEKINGYPAAGTGMETSVLVADRFQVKVHTELAAKETFPKADREEWLKKFDLDGLAKLAK